MAVQTAPPWALRRVSRRHLIGAAGAGTLAIAAGVYERHRRGQHADCIEAAATVLDRAASVNMFARFPHEWHDPLWLPAIRSGSLHIAINDRPVASELFGPLTRERTPFLLASISKPVTATGVMYLVDHGELRLHDPVSKYVPEFVGRGKDAVTIRHLVTHTSGLPDGFPEFTPLLRRQVPYREFVRSVCMTALRYTPGTQFSYSNLGFLMAAEVVERISGLSFRTYLRRYVFEPLGMWDTTLGLGGRPIEDTAGGHDALTITAYDRYWRDFGAPWNGVHSTAADLTRLLNVFMKPGSVLLTRSSALAMIADQTSHLSTSVPVGRVKRALRSVGWPVPSMRRSDRWGLGWMIARRGFGTCCSDEVFGHYGLDGTLAWADPQTGATFVLLTTRPIEDLDDPLMRVVSELASRGINQRTHRGHN